MDNLLWFGKAPQAGVKLRLQERGYRLHLNPRNGLIDDSLLSATSIAVFCYPSLIEIPYDFAAIGSMIDHGLRIMFMVEKSSIGEVKSRLANYSRDFDWDSEVIFVPDATGTNFDNFINVQTVQKWKSVQIIERAGDAKLLHEELLLIRRAFTKAEVVHLQEIGTGFSGARVFLADEKRRQNSIAHWAQPRLVKIDSRKQLDIEVGNMLAVSPFVPFELRPNLDIHVKGFHKSVFVADFVENSESMLDATRAGRAEAAISNLFNRTLHRWRDRARHCLQADEPLAVAAERLGMISPEKIKREYIETREFQDLNLDIVTLWFSLRSIAFKHDAATIHGDLHGKNIRVRGDDAILIDLGSVMGAEPPGAPLCFDVAMLEVALVFDCNEDEAKGKFQDSDWRSSIEHYYSLDSIQRMPDRASVSPVSWRHNCLQRIRAYGIYGQSNKYEYAIALAIAMWRWCKFQSLGDADRGRRAAALQIGGTLIKQIKESWDRESKQNP
jgi:hypothetical protein